VMPPRRPSARRSSSDATKEAISEEVIT
jgi:hypothetical protein